MAFKRSSFSRILANFRRILAPAPPRRPSTIRPRTMVDGMVDGTIDTSFFPYFHYFISLTVYGVYGK
jgi:hypothetical protein